MRRIITHEITKSRNGLGEIIGWVEGVTFSEGDKPYFHKMHEYEFFFESDDPDSVKITAIDPEIAFAIFKHHYRLDLINGLQMAERRVVYTDIPLPISQID